MLGFLGFLAGLAALLYATTRPDEEELEPLPAPEEEDVIDADFREGWVWYAPLADWESVHETWLNEWPADTDITLTWSIKNTGTLGAYFQVYLFEPGEWLYLEPDDRLQVIEEYHTPPLPLVPGYQIHYIHILGRKVTGERIGSVWTSEEIEIRYV